ncbi:amyloid protein-binding protein 2 [Aplysia californica]|uniref:Amyloid protein-binding protein 2 n=1 Tax=Aplysia californica TaxID=6500 RepID=A0ABM0JJB3_APLCA|nr:amyloid protein-binding protein 2 [Aplysia californica]
MARASELEWAPESLYNTAISAVVSRFSEYRHELKNLTDDVIFDVYYKLYDKNGLVDLGNEFRDLDVFSRVLKVNNKRVLLHRCFQAIMDTDVSLSRILANEFCWRLTSEVQADETAKGKMLQFGFSLGSFLCEAGWFADSITIYTKCLKACINDESTPNKYRAMEFAVRLLHSQNVNCQYGEAEETYNTAVRICEDLESRGHKVNKAVLHSEHCALLFAQSKYTEAFNTCHLAILELNPNMPPMAIVNVMRLCSKACVVKREFKSAELLMKYAVAYAREKFGKHHPKHADTLLDYGFFLLNSDCVVPAVQVYQLALDIRQNVFGGNNLYVAIACEDLAYASYVNEYSSGKFRNAKDHAEKSMAILNKILPENHLLLSSSKRVKALILEEIGIDCNDKTEEKKYLEEALKLHLSSLAQTRKAFGEENVQTAKHYGNLGRLCQSMKRHEDAERMHKQAIEIKERLLGPDDYEVALSVGHLASLFNYDMFKYDEAEKLYLRSVKIGRQLFGEGYSGLEYDYRGLVRLYTQKRDFAQADHYRDIINQWSILRDTHNAREFNPLEYEITMTIPELVEQVMRNHALALNAGKGTDHKGDNTKETAERSSGE